MEVEERISQYTKKSRFNQLLFSWLFEKNKHTRNSISDKFLSLYYFERVDKILDDIMDKEEQSTDFEVNYINRDTYEIIIKIDGVPTHIIKKNEDLCLPLLYVNFLYYYDTFPGLADRLEESLPNLGYNSIFGNIRRYVLETIKMEMFEADIAIERYELLDIKELKCSTLEEALKTLENIITKTNLFYERLKNYQSTQDDEEIEKLNNKIRILETELARKDQTIDELMQNINVLEEKQKKKSLPEEISTPELIKYWERLRDLGIVDKYYQLVEKRPGPELAYIARCFFEKMGIDNQWSLFESFWGVSNLAQNNDKIRQQRWRKPIDIVFEKEDEITVLKKKIKKL